MRTPNLSGIGFAIRRGAAALLSAARDPRISVLIVPILGVALLMGSNGSASNAAVTTTTTTTLPELITPTTAPSTDVLGATEMASGDVAADDGSADVAGSSGGSYSGATSSGSSRRNGSRGSSAGSATVPADVAVAAETTIAGQDQAATTVPAGATETTAAPTTAPTTVPTTSTTVVTPEPVIGEASNPVLMIVLALGVTFVVSNGLLGRSRRRLSDGGA